MGRVRAVLRLLALAVLSGVLYLFLQASCWPRDRLRRLRGRPRATGPWRTRIFGVWARCVAAVIGMRVEVAGSPPRPPFLMVANHLGYIDVILLASHLRCVFVAKSEVADWPVVGALCRAVDTLFIDRRVKRDVRRVMDRIDEILAGGRGVIFFPEGTSTGGDAVARFRPSLLEAAVESGRPVSYAGLSYRTPPGCPPARQVVCWWGEMEFPGHLLELLRLPGFRATLKFGEEPILATDRKVLADRLHRAVERQLEAVVRA